MSFRALAWSCAILFVVGMGVIAAFAAGVPWAPSVMVAMILLSITFLVADGTEWQRKHDALVADRVKESQRLHFAAKYLDEALVKIFLIVEPSRAGKSFYAGSIQFAAWRRAFIERNGGVYNVVSAFLKDKIPGREELPPSTSIEQLDDILASWKDRLNG